MRVVAGTVGGRRLVTPAGRDTRPTSDRVREAVFNSLGSMDVIDGAVVLDLFAGSGALGIEALSRGAERATFVDHDRQAVNAIEANLAATGLGGCSRVVRAEALSWLGREQFRGPDAGEGPAFDLALLDPPYGFDRWPELLSELPASVAVIESDREIDPGEGWDVTRVRHYGGTVVALARRHLGTSSELT
jgi:16S rRNA (guanine966-N2)-methyltransferase